MDDHIETFKGLDNKHFDFNLIICTIGPISVKGFKMQLIRIILTPSQEYVSSSSFIVASYSYSLFLFLLFTNCREQKDNRYKLISLIEGSNGNIISLRCIKINFHVWREILDMYMLSSLSVCKQVMKQQFPSVNVKSSFKSDGLETHFKTIHQMY